MGELGAPRSDLPFIMDEGQLMMEPEAILDTRWVKGGPNFIEESLVKWRSLV